MKRRKYKYILLFIDWIAINLSFAAAIALQSGIPFSSAGLTELFISGEFLLFVAYSPVVLYILQSNQLYRLHIHLEVIRQIRKVVACLLYASVGLAFAMFVLGDYWMADARLVVFYFLGASIPVMAVERV